MRLYKGPCDHLRKARLSGKLPIWAERGAEQPQVNFTRPVSRAENPASEARKPDIELRPVYKKDEIQLVDIFIGGRWIGSRRTKAQCLTYIDSRGYLEAQTGVEPVSQDLQSRT